MNPLDHLQPAQGLLAEEADVIVVGSGAAGATCALRLAEAGLEVLLLEEGLFQPLKDRARSLPGAARTVFRGYGMASTVGRALIPYLQGCTVGGTTTINAGIIWRLPETVHAQWSAADEGFARRHPYERFTREFDRIERDLGVAPVDPRVAGMNNHLMERGCRKLGVEGRWIHRNAPDCEGTGICLAGCPKGNKMSMDASYVPRAMAHGARLYVGCRVERLRGFHRARADRFVEATLRDPRTGHKRGRLTARARLGVILAASAVQTPALLQHNRLGNRVVGTNFMAHPGCAVAGQFDEDVRMWNGVHQGYECLAWRKHGIKLESLGLPPEMAAVRFPGIGAEWAERLADLHHVALWALAVRCEARGRVRAGPGGAPLLSFCPSPTDTRAFQKGVRALSDLMFAAGARSVLPGLHGIPAELTDPAKTALIEDTPLSIRDFQVLMTHMMASTPMGSRAASSAVDLEFRVRDAHGLYVADSSVFPSNIGVNPQHTIMAFAGMCADAVLDAHSSRR